MITVFGSINVDLVTRVARIPTPGETVLGESYAVFSGGKGANQALAAARAGATVAFVGAIGPDGFAATATRLLSEGGVDLSGLRTVEANTGAAFITIDSRGENCIVVASGANAHARAAHLDISTWTARHILVMQREIPAAEVTAASRLARGCGARVILNAAPSGGFDAACLAHVDILIVNEHEARDVARALAWTETDPDAIARRLAANHDLATIVTLGAAGALGWRGGSRHAVPAPPANVVDTTGAGDAFCGAFAAALHRGASWRDAMSFGAAAGSLACARAGAQPSLPDRIEIERLLMAMR